ncbi:MAG TPA: PEP-CTERM sorting domain-containing protein, partial [Candidatus Sulfopaludibacter sp.]|nr:PEP-CTERM sorting domain-containing protein [Candidatus Sulfopaludibacter sp.]
DSPANSDFPKFQIASEQWQSGSQASAISVKPPAPGKGTVKYEIIFATSTSGSDSSGAWYELPYTGATAPLPNFANYGYQPVTLSNVGYQLSPTLIPLDNLNFGDYPPPGQSNSGFTPLPQFDGSTFNGTPEPSMLLPMAAAAAVLARRRKRQSV